MSCDRGKAQFGAGRNGVWRGLRGSSLRGFVSCLPQFRAIGAAMIGLV